MKVFVNHSNHPTYKWGEEQLNAAKEMADLIVDIPFPQIDPEATEFDIVDLVNKNLDEFMRQYQDMEDIIFHIAGEPTYVTYFVSQVNKWHGNKAICLTSTTKRDVIENLDGSKTVKFGFVRFRQYLTV